MKKIRPAHIFAVALFCASDTGIKTPPFYISYLYIMIALYFSVVNGGFYMLTDSAYDIIV